MVDGYEMDRYETGDEMVRSKCWELHVWTDKGQMWHNNHRKHEMRKAQYSWPPHQSILFTKYSTQGYSE